METIITLIVIGVLIAASVMTYQYKKVKTRQFLLSEQLYPSNILSVFIQKFQNNITHIIIQLKAIEKIHVVELSIELINKKREFNYYDLNKEGLIAESDVSINAEETFKFTFDYDKFKSLLENGELTFRTFRFIITDDSGKKYKSHELGLNKKWQLLKPDSGTYN